MLSTLSTTRVGVIGTGHFATAVVTQSESIPNLSVAAVADLNPDAARRAFRLAAELDVAISTPASEWQLNALGLSV